MPASATAGCPGSGSRPTRGDGTSTGSRACSGTAAARAEARRRWRRSTSSTGSARNAAPTTRPAASSMVFSHRGMPLAAGAPVPAGSGTVPAACRRRRRRHWVRAARARRGRRRRGRAPDRQHGPGADRVRVRTDDPPVGRVQRRPAAAHGEHGGDARQRVTGRDRVADRSHPARQHQDGAGADRCWDQNR